MVSVLMVTCNHGPFVRRAVESVLAQSFTDFELIICDDGSADDTAAYLRGLADPRVRVVCHDRNRGIREAYREGIAACRGEYLAFLEGDDAWVSANLQKKIEVLARNPGVGLVYSNVAIDADEATRGAKRFYLRSILSVPQSRPFDPCAYVSRCNPIPTFSAVVMRKELTEGLVYPPERFQPWLDWFFWNQLGFRTSFFFCPERLVTWRHHPDSLYGRESGKGFYRVKFVEAGLRVGFLCKAWKEPLSLGKKIFVTISFVRGLLIAALSRIFGR